MHGFPFYAGVLLAAFGESTALVGLLVPGVGIVVAAGVLAARGDGNLIGVALAASAGSIAGFGLSFHLGRAGGKRLSRWSLRASAAIEKAQAFLDRFGGWAVFWGHFFGPVRACVALVAGAGGLSSSRFWIASVVGGLAWGFGLAAGGAALSGGWRVLEGALGRGSLLVAGFAAALYVSLRVSVGTIALGLRLLTPASKWLTDALGRAADSPRLRSLGPAHPLILAWLQRRLSPDRATGLLLSVGAAICACFAALFFGVAEGVVFHEPLVRLDLNLFHLLQTLRSPNGDRFFLWVTYLGSGPVLAAAAAAGACALLALRRRFEAGLLLVGFGSGEFLMWCLKSAFARPRPAPSPFFPSELSAAFPSNHAFSSVALFGFLCYLLTRGLPSPTRARLFAGTGVAVVAVGVSRLYLGAHWASDVAAGYALGVIWLVALVTGGEARSRFGPRTPARVGLSLAWGAAVLGVVGLSWVLVARREVPADLARHPAPAARMLVNAAELLPVLEQLSESPVETLAGDSLGRISLFVLSDEAPLRRAVQGSAWVVTAELRPATLAERWAKAWKGALGTDAAAYPRFWRGRPQKFSLSRPGPRGDRWVARCWGTGLTAANGGEVLAIWLREELSPRRLFGVPVPGLGRRPRERADAGLLSGPLLGSGSFAPVPGAESLPFQVLARAPSPAR